MTHRNAASADRTGTARPPRGARPARNRVEFRVAVHRRVPPAGPLRPGAKRAERVARVSRWLEVVRVPNRQAAMVLDDVAQRWAEDGICPADLASVSDISESRAAFQHTLRVLEAAGLIRLTAALVGSSRLIVPCVDASITPEAWRSAALSIARPTHPRSDT